jgi:hypothetical protein
MLNVCEFLVEGFGVDFKAKSPTRPRAETVEGSRGHRKKTEIGKIGDTLLSHGSQCSGLWKTFRLYF